VQNVGLPQLERESLLAVVVKGSDSEAERGRASLETRLRCQSLGDGDELRMGSDVLATKDVGDGLCAANWISDQLLAEFCSRYTVPPE